MGRNTARSFREALAAAELLDGPTDELPELAELKAAVARHLPATTPPQQVSSVDTWAGAIEDMADKGAMPRAIYDALRLEHPGFDGSYDAVKRFWRVASMPIVESAAKPT